MTKAPFKITRTLDRFGTTLRTLKYPNESPGVFVLVGGGCLFTLKSYAIIFIDWNCLASAPRQTLPVSNEPVKKEVKP